MKYLFLLSICITFLNCSSVSSKCDNAVGFWISDIDKSDELSKFVIIKEENNFVIRTLDHDGYLGSNFRAILECSENKLKLNGVPMLGNVDIGLLNDETILMMGKTFKKKSSPIKGNNFIVINEGYEKGIFLKISKRNQGYYGQIQNGKSFTSSDIWEFKIKDENTYNKLGDFIGQEVKVHYTECINLESKTVNSEYIVDDLIL